MSALLTQACINLRPQAGISIDEDGIHWYNVDDIPSEEEIQVELDRLNALEASNDYKLKRAAEYPDFKDYLDGVVKNDQVQIQKYIDDCLAVKAKYPKPE